MNRRPDVICIAILLFACACLWVPRLRGPIDVRWDAGVYYTTGTSLAEGKGYRLINEPGDALSVQYPPLLPAIVAVVEKASGSTDYRIAGQWLRYVYFAIFTAYILALYALSRRYVSPIVALIVGLLTAIHHQTFFLSDLLFAEIPFALCVMVLLLLNKRSDKPLAFAGAAAAGVAAFLLRSAGIAVLGAWCLEALLRKQWKQCIYRAIPACIAILGWQFYVSSVTHSKEYQSPRYEYERAAYMYYNVPYADNIRLIDPFKPELGVANGTEMRHRVLDNVTQLPKSIGEVLTSSVSVWQWLGGKVVHKLHLPKPSDGLITALLFIFRALPLVGLAMLLYRRDWMIPTIVAASVALMCLTPWPGQFARYLTPVAGLLILCAAIAAVQAGKWISSATKREWTQPIPLGLAVAVSFAAAFPMIAKIYAPRLRAMIHPHQPISDRLLFYYDDKWTAYADALDWLHENAKPNSILATDTPHWAYIRTGLKSVMLPMEKNPAEACRLLDTVPVNYVVIDRPDVGEIISRYGLPAVTDNPDWELIYTGKDGQTRIYQRQNSTK